MIWVITKLYYEIGTESHHMFYCTIGISTVKHAKNSGAEKYF